MSSQRMAAVLRVDIREGATDTLGREALSAWTRAVPSLHYTPLLSLCTYTICFPFASPPIIVGLFVCAEEKRILQSRRGMS